MDELLYIIALVVAIGEAFTFLIMENQSK